MKVNITPTRLLGEVFAPPSKSYAHRLLIASFLSGKRVEIKNVGDSFDVQATLGALESIGAKVEKTQNGVIVERTVIEKTDQIYCRESGSTLRFLVPVVAGLGIKGEFTGEKRLMERPLGELIDTLNERGANIIGRTVNGKLKSGRYVINAGISSQYITGLLLALPLLNGDSELHLDGNVVSKGYIDITLDVLKQFGIKIEKKDYGFFVKGNQTYTPPNSEIWVEGDYSGASFTLSLGALSDNGITVKGLNPNSCQGDREIVNVLKKFGAKVETKGANITVSKGKLNSVELDCENIPDLVQIISVVASFAKGESMLKNVDRLRIKESDRVQAILDMLDRAGISARYSNNAIYVKGGQPRGAIFQGGNDHRTVMSSTILSVNATSDSEIIGAEAITKSYPAFFEDIIKLGGKISG